MQYIRNYTRFAICFAWMGLATVHAADLQDDRAEIDRRFADELETLAKKCDELKLAQQAQQTRGWLIDRDPQRQYLFLPDHPDTTNPPAAASELIRYWHKHFRAARDKHADDLFALSKHLLEQHQPTAAYQLLHEILWHSPDHEEARRILGYRKLHGRWWQGVEKVSVSMARVRHPLFDWPPRTYWRVETPHFEITTSHSVKQGKEFGQRLELLHDVWRQVFYEYWGAESDLAAAFEGQHRPLRAEKKHRVVLFRDRDEYVGEMQRRASGIEVSSGYYAPERQTSYFYAGEETVATWFHEVTHQLFAEIIPTVPDVGVKENFWITEAVAMYMESLQTHDGYATLGGFDAARLQYSRYRALNQRFYVPLAELIPLGRDEMYQDDRLRALYTQSAGLAHFLMDYQSGRFRDATVAYLRIVYAGRDRSDTVERLAAVPLAELDKAYHEFLEVTDVQVAKYLGPPETLNRLSLGHTSITDAALEKLATATNLQWLDLAGTAVTDEGLRHLRGAVNLVELSLDGTQIGDQSLAVVERFKNLELLDLAETDITDAGLARLASLTDLKQLWLTGTKITDAGLQSLGSLKKLETLDTTGTRVTAAGREHLRRELPNLQE